MSMTNVFDIAVEVANKLNEDPEKGWNAQVVQAIRNEASELNDMTISVLPYSVHEKDATRCSVYRTVSIAVAIQKRIEPAQWASEVKTMLDTVEELKEELRGTILQSGYRYISDEQDPIYQQDHLLEQSVFTTVVEFEFTSEECVLAS